MRKYGLLVKAALRLHIAYSSGFQPVGYRSILWWATDKRVARIWKRGGYFERVRKVQTSLTRIFIVLESVSHGLSENWDEISRKARKFKGFFRPKTGGLQKKKKRSSLKLRLTFRPKSDIQRFFPPKNRWSQKKGLHWNWDWFFGRNPNFVLKILRLIFRLVLKIQTFKVGLFSYRGAIFNFSQKIGLKSTKNVRFCILH